MSATEERTAYVGAPVRRREDAALLTGRGTYVDNMAPPGTLTMAVVRSPYAHARVNGIDFAAAREADGVVAVFSAADLEDDWKAPLPCAWPVTEDMKSPDHYPLTDVASLPGGRRRGRAGGEPHAGARRGRARRGRLRAARGDRRRLEGARGRGGARPARPRHERVLRLAPRHGRDRTGDRRRRRRRDADVLPAAADPERDRAPCGAGRAGSHRRRDALLDDPGAAHLAAARGGRTRPARDEAAESSRRTSAGASARSSTSMRRSCSRSRSRGDSAGR